MPTKEEMHNLVQGITASFEARTAGITALRGEVGEQRQATQTQVRELDRTHRAMARQQRAYLARGRADLEQGHEALARAEGRRKTEANTWLHKVDQAHQAMARQLQAGLSRERAALTGVEGQRKAEVQEWIGQVATEHNGARQEWRRLTRTMGSERNGAVMTEEFTALSDRVFQHLANHPDGTRLTEIEREFGLGRLQAGRVVRHLMDEGKAEKRDLCYFAT
jgi:hypothetical protein